jgi:hypothetical protein
MSATDSVLPAAFENAYDSMPSQITRADALTSKATGIQDAEHIDLSGALEAHLVQPVEGYRTSALAYDTWVDVEPRSPNTPTWGKQIKFNVGLEGHALLTRIEVFFQLEAITQPNGVTVTDGNATVYPQYLAERLLGEEVEIKLQQERIEKTNVDAMHFERMLLQDIANAERSGYERGVGIEETAEAQTVWVPIRMPYSRDSPLVALGFAEEVRGETFFFIYLFNYFCFSIKFNLRFRRGSRFAAIVAMLRVMLMRRRQP